MKITILGSGGGEGFPAAFCGCDHCNAARKAGGKSLRSLSQTLINGDLLIDFPQDTRMHALSMGINLGDVSNVIVTHTHSDHFVPAELMCRGGCYAHNIKSPTLTLWGSSDVKKVYDSFFAIFEMNKTVAESIFVREFSANLPHSVGDYTVIPLPARHGRGLIPYNYFISDGEKTLLYLLDTGYPTEETLAAIKKYVKHADCVIMDATMGVAPVNAYFGHMGFEENKLLKERLLSDGVASERTVFVADHITHNKAETHDKIEEIFSGTGIIVAYDGMTIDI